jgi:RNA polymerase sigma factor (sigma-70 family)
MNLRNLQQENAPEIHMAPGNVKSSALASKTDWEIWRELKSGSEVALVFIYQKYFQTLYRYGSQFTRDRPLLKDTIQDLFIELIKRRSRLSDTTSIKYYLLKSIKINLLSKLKKLKRIDYQNDLVEGFDFDISLSHEQILINHQITEEQRLRINQALQGLTRKQREIIYYFYFQNLPLSEIAPLMSFSGEKSAQNLLYRALAVLRQSMGYPLLMLFLSIRL